MTLFFPRRHSYFVNWQNKCFMGPTFSLNISIYLCFIYEQLCCLYRLVDLQKRFLSGFYALFWWRKQINLFQSASFNALLKEKQDTYSHLLKGLSVKNRLLIRGVRILIHSPRTHNAELRKNIQFKNNKQSMLCDAHTLLPICKLKHVPLY